MRALTVSILLVSLLVATGSPAAAAPGSGPVRVADAFAPPPIEGAVDVTETVVTGLPPTPRLLPGLDSALSQVADAATRSPAAALGLARAAGVRTSAGNVQVELNILPRELQTVRTLVARTGGDVTGVSDDGARIEALLPVGMLRRLAQEPGILTIRRPALVEPVFGLQNTQGDAALNGPAWRASGTVGAGVKVGIIDVGFAGYPALLGTDLPSTVTVKNFVGGETDAQVNGTTPHGTACAEVIHDVAPGAQLYLAKVATTADIEDAADWLQTQGVRVISSSIGTYNVSPGDGTGILEDLVAEKRAAGITWFTAASNDREAHWGGPANINATDKTHYFAAGQNVNFFTLGGSAASIGSGFRISVHVRWNDWTAPVDQNFNVVLLRWNGTGWAPMLNQIGGFDPQTGQAGHRPTETASGFTSGAATAYGWAVERVGGSASVDFEMFAPKVTPLDVIVNERSLSSLADANSAVTVAALNVSGFAQEPYSSEGPTNGAGGSATGGNTKPDISAFANVNTVSYGSGTGKFNGTSAATPHVAGAAALALQANPGFTPNALESFLTSRAVDQGAPGADNDFGSGRLDLGAAPSAVDNAAPSVGIPTADFRTGVAVGTAGSPVKLRVAFTATDSSLISRTRLEQKVGTAAYANVALATYQSTGADVAVGTSNTTLRRFRARATDFALNTSAFATAGAFKVRVFQNGAAGVAQSGSWTTQSNTRFYGGTVRHTNVAGRKQTLAATMQDVAIVTTKGPNRGIARVFVDGVEVATVDLYNSTTQYRQVVWATSFGTSGAHTVEWRVTGTKRPASTSARVDLDAFLIMQP